MDAKELHDELRGGGRMWVEGASDDEEDTILRALSLLAAAEANDGTTPETDAVRDFTWRCEHHPEHQGGMVTTRMIEARLLEEADELRDFARRLERERNAALRALEMARHALAEIREEWAGAECGEPVTAQEGYAIGLVKRMYQLAVEGLK